MGVPGATEKLWYALEASPQALRGNVLGFAIPTIFLGVTAFQSKRSFFCGHPVDSGIVFYVSGKSKYVEFISSCAALTTPALQLVVVTIH